MAKVFLTLTDDERQALINLAQQEKRYPRDQAALLLRRALEDAGYLVPWTASAIREREVFHGSQQ